MEKRQDRFITAIIDKLSQRVTAVTACHHDNNVTPRVHVVSTPGNQGKYACC